MTCGLVHASHSLPEWQAVKLTFFAPCLTLVSNVCEAAPKSLFWVPSGLNELPEMCFEFSFNLIDKLTMFFFNRPIMTHTPKQDGAQDKDFSAVSQTDLMRS